ncbi:MAG: glucose-1-phosphate cytidylyltransferase [Bacteroidetes bacterium]|nr:glucose-1-phosphate cytidylyltransferase [Bacteroidota bacterium]
MKVVILAGGIGSRLSEETDLKPKPMVEIGGKPILWHIMKIYSHYGFNDFIILCGYKGYMIKAYFANYFRHTSDLTVNLRDNSVEYHKIHAEPWKVTLIDTGIDTMTGGRIRRVKDYIGNEPFMLTYGDGVSDVNIPDLIKFHKSQGGFITLTAVLPEGKFGALDIGDDSRVNSFKEKPKGDGSWVNAGFFVCEPEVMDFIEDRDDAVFEREPLFNLAKAGKMSAYKHHGFWKPMDMLRDKLQLEEMIQTHKAPWIKW